MTEVLLAGEYLARGDPVYIKDGVVYKLRVMDSAIECEHYENSDVDYDCDWMEMVCPLDLPNRKYCRDYKPVK
jgi:hypothetical protein